MKSACLPQVMANLMISTSQADPPQLYQPAPGSCSCRRWGGRRRRDEEQQRARGRQLQSLPVAAPPRRRKSNKEEKVGHPCPSPPDCYQSGDRCTPPETLSCLSLPRPAAHSGSDSRRGLYWGGRSVPVRDRAPVSSLGVLTRAPHQHADA